MLIRGGFSVLPHVLIVPISLGIGLLAKKSFLLLITVSLLFFHQNRTAALFYGLI